MWRYRNNEHTPTPAQVTAVLHKFCDEEKDTVLDGMTDSIIATDRSRQTGATKSARDLLNARWNNDKTSMVSGKTLIAKLNDWTQAEFGTSLGAPILARSHSSSEIHEEVRTIITHIEEGTPFPGP